MARFVSRQRNFRIFLKMEDSGGKWADFGDRGEYETKNPEDAEKLRSTPNFKRDFYEVGEVDNKPKETYICPEEGCGKTFDTPKKIVCHARMVHKSYLKEKDIEKVEKVKVA